MEALFQDTIKQQPNSCIIFGSKMKHRAAKLSLFLIVVVIVLSHRSAEANQKPSEKDFGVVRESLITTSHEEIEGSQFSSKSNEVRSDNSNAVNSSSLESERRHSFNKRWSASYEKRAEPRVLFPLSYSTPQRKPNYGLPSKGYRPIKAPPIGYPAARPPTSAYRPPAFKPTKPPQAYGPPKPTGYPPSSNYQQIEQVYITYPPATTTVSYSQGSNYANSGGLYATSTSGAQSGFTGGSYLPPKPSSPAQQSNGNLISFPNPNYEVPIGYPAITSKPNYYTTTKATPTYPSPNQVHSSWSGQTSYPGFPAANTNYPAPSSGSYRPKPTLAPSYTAHATPSTSYGSIHHGPVTSGHLPVFVFIPKPVYSSAQNSYKPAYPKPTVTYPAPSNYYSTVKPSTITHTHYYPAPQYVKPPKPSGVYPPAKAPSTAYGLPKPLAIYSSNRPSGSSYRTDNSQQVSIYSKEHSINQPFDVRLQGGQIYPNSNPLRTHDSSKQAVVASSQPSSFQRGNSVKQSANTNALASSFIDDFKASPIIVGDQIQHSSIQNQTKNGFDGAESNQFFAITDLQGKLEDFPLYRERLRIPFRPESVPNDCGGSWVVLRQPTGSYPDPTQVQIHPIPYSFENSNNGDFNPNLSGQSLRSPDDLSFVTFPPKFNDLPAFDPVLKSIRPGFPDFLVFSTTPNPNSNGIQLHNDATKELWRKPNSIHPLISTISLSDDSKLTDSSIVDQEILSQAVTIKPSVRGSTTALFSTENSIIVSSNAVSSLHNKDKVEFPIEGASPFLVDIITPFNDELNNKTGKSIVNSLSPTEDILTETHFNRNSAELIEDSDRLISLLRAANLRALSSLIAQADIAGLLFDKGILFFLVNKTSFISLISVNFHFRM